MVRGGGRRCELRFDESPDLANPCGAVNQYGGFTFFKS